MSAADHLLEERLLLVAASYVLFVGYGQLQPTNTIPAFVCACCCAESVHDQGWQGRWGALTSAPRPSPPGEISAPRPAPPSAPGLARVTIQGSPA